MLAIHEIPLGSRPVSHRFAPGAITVVLGRNRSGKTRLCRLIAGLETPGSGRVELDGIDVTDQPPGRRDVALVYQAFVNYPNLSVHDNIASPLVAQRRSRQDIRARVAEIAGQLGLAELQDRLPSQLSGGQQQRLAIARALAKSARVLLLDEPLVNLDYKLREGLEAELRTTLADAGVTVVYTTSDPRDAFNLGDEVVLLEGHRILQHGAPLGVYQHPVSPAAADLMSEPGVNRFVEGGSVCVVRPEHLALQPFERCGARFRLAVLTVETSGSETYLHGLVAGEHWVAKLPGLHRIESGEEVLLHAPQHAILRFPVADG
jgi:glycerol transport system ATP-binding protein